MTDDDDESGSLRDEERRECRRWGGTEGSVNALERLRRMEEEEAEGACVDERQTMTVWVLLVMVW